MTVLDRIVKEKLDEVARLGAEADASVLRARALQTGPCRDLVAALKSCPRVPVIAEIKRASPSAGKLRDLDDVASLARSYEQAGAAALSVLTDEPFFRGSLDDLIEARGSVKIPVLRKDFIVDPLQLYQSRVAGADAVLLIAAALSPRELRSLFHETLTLGMTPVVEVHNETELAGALDLDPPIVGVNNRDLATLEVDLETCVRLGPAVPAGTIVLGESGINGPEDVVTLLKAGVDAFLVGTTLMKSPDPAVALDRLCRARR